MPSPPAGQAVVHAVADHKMLDDLRFRAAGNANVGRVDTGPLPSVAWILPVHYDRDQTLMETNVAFSDAAEKQAGRQADPWMRLAVA